MSLSDSRQKGFDYVCIYCGHTTDTLFNKYKGGVIKIPLCAQCGCCVDKYVEYDLVIISLDVLLLKQQAFRHILVNSNIQSPWKFGLVLLLCEAFTKLLRQRQAEEKIDMMPDYVIYSALEVDLYWNFLVAVLELFSLVLSVLLMIWCWKVIVHKDGTWPSVHSLTSGVLLSSLGKILVLPAMLWDGKYGGIYAGLSLIFTLAANLQAIKVLCPSMNHIALKVSVLLGHYVAYSLSSFLIPTSSSYPII